MIRLTISVAGVTEMDRAIERFTGGVSDLSDVWPEVRDEFYAIEQEQFDSEGGAGDTGSWAPLSPAYAEWKAKNFGSMPILQRSGRLMALMTGGMDVDMQPLSLRLNTDDVVARYHQLGTSRMPARQVVALTDGNRSRLMRIIQSWLVQRARDEFGAPGFSGGGA